MNQHVRVCRICKAVYACEQGAKTKQALKPSV
jgi:hypothetical protein